MGGPSTEAEVSRRSASSVQAALSSRGHDVVCLELGAELAETLRSLRPAVVVPVAHGAFGEDGRLQGLLDILGMPYVGSGVLASASAADKSLTKVLYRAAGLPVAQDAFLNASELRALEAEGAIDALSGRLKVELGPELIVKPNTGGSTVGIVRLLRDFSIDELAAGIRSAQLLSDGLLIESYHRGLELTCGVLESGGHARALPPTLIRAKKSDFYDFSSKYAEGGSEHVCPAPLPEAWLEAIQSAALAAHRVLGARDLSRTDFILDPNSGEFIVLETNTLPGMTSVSLYPEQAAAVGLSFPDLLEVLVAEALRRGSPQLVHAEPFPS